MSTLTGDTARPLAKALRARLSLPLPVAVLASRVLVLAGAVVGATATHRVAAWQLADPQHLTLSLGSFGNVLAAGSLRWDSVHYLAIAAHGYNTPSNTVFFPLYPVLIHLVGWVTRSDVIAGALISCMAFAVALLLLHRLTREELGVRAANATVLLLAFSPVSLFFTAIYTESLFLVLCLGAFLLARRARWGWAGLAASAATLTHVEGILLIAPLAIFYWQDHHRDVLRSGTGAARLRSALALVLPLMQPVVALAGFLVYLHSRGYGWLAPSSNERYYKHHFAGPISGVLQGVRAGFTGLAHIIAGSGGMAARDDAFQNVLYLVVLAICAITLVVAWKQLPKSYSAFSALCLLVCVSSPVAGAPLTSLDRYVLVLFPLWMVAARWLDHRRRLGSALVGSGMLLFVFALQFARWAFIG